MNHDLLETRQRSQEHDVLLIHNAFQASLFYILGSHRVYLCFSICTCRRAFPDTPVGATKLFRNPRTPSLCSRPITHALRNVQTSAAAPVYVHPLLLYRKCPITIPSSTITYSCSAYTRTVSGSYSNKAKSLAEIQPQSQDRNQHSPHHCPHSHVHSLSNTIPAN